jgi:PhnB protein
MPSRLNPYLSFKDNARAAMEFYKTVFGGKLELHTFAEYQASDDPADQDKIMHAMLEAGNGLTFMASDTPSRMDYQPAAGISMSLSGDDDAELSGYFTALSDGGKITMPLEKAPWGDKFGMVVDQFGITWMINISGPKDVETAGKTA